MFPCTIADVEAIGRFSCARDQEQAQAAIAYNTFVLSINLTLNLEQYAATVVKERLLSDYIANKRPPRYDSQSL